MNTKTSVTMISLVLFVTFVVETTVFRDFSCFLWRFGCGYDALRNPWSKRRTAELSSYESSSFQKSEIFSFRVWPAFG